MAIQLRRGAYENFDPTKMKPAEVAVVQSGDPTSYDGKAVYVAIQAGDIKRMAALDELQDEVYNQVSSAIDTATQEAVTTATAAAEASATAAAQSASAAAESARTLVIDNTLSQSGQAGGAKATGDALAKRAYGNVFYVNNSGDVTWTETSPVVFNVGTNNFTLLVNNNTYAITPAEILTAAESVGLTVEGNTISYTSYLIYYDIDAQTVKVAKGATNATARTIVSKYPVIFFGHYASVRAGLAVDYMTRKRFLAAESAVEQNGTDIANIQADVADIQSDMSGIQEDIASIQIDTQSIPSAFYDNLNAKIPSIIANMNEAGSNGTTFVFITDLHWETNYKKSPALVKYILDKTSVKNVFCGGDLINQGEKDVMSATLLDCINHFRFIPNQGFFPVTRGNHDDNSNWTSSEDVTTYAFDSNTIYNLLFSQVAEKVTKIGNNWTFYFDQNATKTRYIFADTKRNGSTIDTSQIITCLNSVPSGWHVIFIMHFAITREAAEIYAGADVLCHIVSAYNNRETGSYTGTYQTATYDFTNAVGTVDLIIGGHLHADASMDADNENNPSGIPLVATDTDSYRSHPEVEEDAVNSQCFDVVTVNYSAKTVKCVRIGRGSDRTFAY